MVCAHVSTAALQIADDICKGAAGSLFRSPPQLCQRSFGQFEDFRRHGTDSKIPDDVSGRIANLRQGIGFAKLVAHLLIENDALHDGTL